MHFDSRQFRNTVGNFATGVTVVTVETNGETHGMTANSFTSVSLDPPLVLICVDHRANSLQYIKQTGYFGVNILGKEHENISRLFANQKLEEEPVVSFRKSKAGTPLLEGALATMDCKVWQTVEAGDHTIFIGEVLEIDSREGEPLLFFRGKYTELK